MREVLEIYFRNKYLAMGICILIVIIMIFVLSTIRYTNTVTVVGKEWKWDASVRYTHVTWSTAYNTVCIKNVCTTTSSITPIYSYFTRCSSEETGMGGNELSEVPPTGLCSMQEGDYRDDTHSYYIHWQKGNERGIYSITKEQWREYTMGKRYTVKTNILGWVLK